MEPARYECFYTKKFISKLTFFLVIASYYLFVFIQQILFMLNKKILHEEYRQLFPYHLINEPELFNNDYITAYILSSNQPILYEILTRTWLSIGGELADLHHIMPIILWILLLAAAALAGWKLKGAVGSLGVFALVLTQPLFLYQITSAIPHAFAFPLLGWIIVALLYGNIPGLIGLTILSSAIYIPVTPIAGLSLAALLILSCKEKQNKLKISTLTRSVTILSITGCLSILLGTSVLQSKEGFGEYLPPFQEVETYPENGVEGRNFSGTNKPLLYITAKFVDQFRESIGIKWGFLLLLIYLFVTFLGFLAIKRNTLARKGIGIYISASAFVSVLVFVFKPYLAYRFFLYPFLILFSILSTMWIADKFSRVKNKDRALCLPSLVIFLFTLTLDGNSQSKIGYHMVIDEELTQLIDFIQTLPSESLLAGWPNHNVKANITEYIPYLAKRPVLVIGKMHYPTYKEYLLVMRERTYALIDVYTATNKEPFKRLKDNYNANYLLVDKRHFINDSLVYFEPFNEYIKKSWHSKNNNDFVLTDRSLSGKIFETRNYYILDIDKFLRSI